MKTGRTCLAVITALVMICSTASAQRRRAHDPFNDAAAGLIGDVIADVQAVGQGLMALQVYSADLSRRIEQARKAFWAEYPNGPQLAAREAEFNQRLTDKDLLIAGMFLNSSDGCAQGVSGWGLLTGASGIDGGISAHARWSFCQWVRANQRYRKAFNAFSAGATVLQRPEYQAYRRARDWAEFQRAGKVREVPRNDMFKVTEPRSYLIALVWTKQSLARPGTGGEQAVQSYPEALNDAEVAISKLFELHGEEQVLTTTRALMAASKRPEDISLLANPGALGCTAPYVVNCFRTSTENWTLRDAKLPVDRFQQEKAVLEARIARDKRDADAHLKLGELHLKQGQYAEAERSFWDSLEVTDSGAVEDAARNGIGLAKREIAKAPAKPAEPDPTGGLSRPALERSANPNAYAMYLTWVGLMRGQSGSEEAWREVAVQQLAAWDRQYGREVVRRAAETIKAAPKSGDIIADHEAEAVGCHLCASLVAACHIASCFQELLAPTPGVQRAASSAGALPRKIKHVDPVYDPAALQARVPVTRLVMVQITVGTDGRVSNARVLTSAPPFDQAALDAVRQWQYDATGITKPIVTTVTVPFRP